MSALCRDCYWTGDAAPARCPRCRSPRLIAHADLMRLTIAHLDCDAFYASVEKRDRPELRDQPVIVGGGKRGVVTTCCYIARLSGVRSAMPMFQARRLCPEAVVIPPAFTKYRAESARIMKKLEALTPLVQPLSLDEAWIDLAGSERLHGGTAAEVLVRLQAEIEREVGITVSIGLAANKFLAKIASDLDKPRGFSVIGAVEAEVFLSTRPASILPGVGPAFARALGAAGFATVGDLARADPLSLYKRWGAYGLRLSELAHGRDVRHVNPNEARKSISAETTFFDDLSGLDALEDRLWPLCERVGRQARSAGVAGRVATLKLKTADFRLITRRRTLAVPTQAARTLFEVTRALLGAEARGAAYRLIGAGLSDLVDAAADIDMFAEDERKARAKEATLDALRARFGPDAVVSGRTLRSETDRG
ncbi:MAG TPA: DNA polymerase IV [Caulobacteraceae bacterium]|nr:DNA polymerase IV [Caulobacteraceae bacterium]